MSSKVMMKISELFPLIARDFPDSRAERYLPLRYILENNLSSNNVQSLYTNIEDIYHTLKNNVSESQFINYMEYINDLLTIPEVQVDLGDLLLRVHKKTMRRILDTVYENETYEIEETEVNDKFESVYNAVLGLVILQCVSIGLQVISVNEPELIVNVSTQIKNACVYILSKIGEFQF
jgi:hypothetical protein